MTHVQQIEVAVGQRDALARSPPFSNVMAELFAAQDFAVFALARVHQ